MHANKHLINWQNEYTVSVARVTNLRSDKQMFQNVLGLSKSPLCNLILNPLLSAIAPTPVDLSKIEYMGYVSF